MKQKELTNLIEQNYKYCLRLIGYKNDDYADKDYAFSNFESASLQANIPTEKVIISQIGIKISRIRNLIEKEGVVLNESIDDSLYDMINYTALLLAYLQTKREKKKDNSPGTNRNTDKDV